MATFFFFYALKFMAIADTLAIFFGPTLDSHGPLALYIKGTGLDPAAGRPFFVGFIGTLIIIRPGLQEMNAGMFLALAAGTSLALLYAYDTTNLGANPCDGDHVSHQPYGCSDCFGAGMF